MTDEMETDAAWIDPDDAPELTEKFFKHADEFEGTQLIRAGSKKAPTT